MSTNDGYSDDRTLWKWMADRLLTLPMEWGWALANSLVEAIESRESRGRGHGLRVARYSRLIGEELGLPADTVDLVALGGFLHDVGKVGVGDALLQRPDALQPHELQIFMEHVRIGAEIVGRYAALKPVAEIVLHHHEWYGGGGYPDGLRGDAIPLGARIVGLADAFDVLTVPSAYGGPLPWRNVVDRLEALAGTQFWPEGVRALRQRLLRDAANGQSYVRELEEGGQGSRPRQEIPMDLAAGWVERPQGERPEAIGPISPVTTRSFAILSHLATALRAVLDLRSMLAQVVEIIQRDVGYQDVAVFLLNQDDTQQLVLEWGGGAYRALTGLVIHVSQGLSGQALLSGHLVYSPDVRNDRDYLPTTLRTRSEMAVPLAVEGKTLGVLVVDSPYVDGIQRDDVRLLGLVSNELAMAIRVAQLYHETATASNVDGLTQLYNHRYFYDRAEQELARARRYGHPLQVAMIDLDDLKKVNDTHGHLAGDSALKLAAEVLRANTRSSDILARYGGDEFAILFPETDLAAAEQAMERITDAICHAPFWKDEHRLYLSGLSYGLASFPEEGSTPTELISVADRRMYLMKQVKDKAAAEARKGGPPATVTAPGDHNGLQRVL
ncbi:MAG: diguanylate cyclase [Limnochordaceae bacterium]|nr:diguanylate cyclase [Limnochordaceae bacterium]